MNRTSMGADLFDINLQDKIDITLWNIYIYMIEQDSGYKVFRGIWRTN